MMVMIMIMTYYAKPKVKAGIGYLAVLFLMVSTVK